MSIKETVREFAEITNEVYGNHAFACGYFESTIVEMFDRLSKKDQAYLLSAIKRSTEKQESQLTA